MVQKISVHFISAVDLMKEMNSDNNETILVKFIYTKLTGNARIGLQLNLTTINDLLADIKSRCEDKTNPLKILADLKSIKTRESVKLCKEVELLTFKLKGLYLQQSIPEKIANDMALQAGIDTVR